MAPWHQTYGLIKSKTSFNEADLPDHCLSTWLLITGKESLLSAPLLFFTTFDWLESLRTQGAPAGLRELKPSTEHFVRLEASKDKPRRKLGQKQKLPKASFFFII